MTTVPFIFRPFWSIKQWEAQNEISEQQLRQLSSVDWLRAGWRWPSATGAAMHNMEGLLSAAWALAGGYSFLPLLWRLVRLRHIAAGG